MGIIGNLWIILLHTREWTRIESIAKREFVSLIMISDYVSRRRKFVNKLFELERSDQIVCFCPSDTCGQSNTTQLLLFGPVLHTQFDVQDILARH